MSRFEINPDTREPYVQEPRVTREPLTAKPLAVAESKAQPEQDSRPQTATPTTRTLSDAAKGLSPPSANGLEPLPVYEFEGRGRNAPSGTAVADATRGSVMMADQDESGSVPDGDRVTDDPTGADEEVVPEGSPGQEIPGKPISDMDPPGQDEPDAGLE